MTCVDRPCLREHFIQLPRSCDTGKQILKLFHFRKLSTHECQVFIPKGIDISGLFPFWPSVYTGLSASYITKENPVSRTDTETQLEKIEVIVLNRLFKAYFINCGRPYLSEEVVT
jgi:hypothetical protein